MYSEFPHIPCAARRALPLEIYQLREILRAAEAFVPDKKLRRRAQSIPASKDTA